MSTQVQYKIMNNVMCDFRLNIEPAGVIPSFQHATYVCFRCRCCRRGMTFLTSGPLPAQSAVGFGDTSHFVNQNRLHCAVIAIDCHLRGAKCSRMCVYRVLCTLLLDKMRVYIYSEVGSV